MKRILIYILGVFIFSSCEEVIIIDVNSNSETQLVVDAWFTNELKPQVVQLSVSQAYFDTTKVSPALGAKVSLIFPDKSVVELKDPENKGKYIFNPKTADFIKQGESLQLIINYQNQNYSSISKLGRVPKIDSLTYEFTDQPNGPPVAGAPREGYLAEFYARDPVGEGDTYLIRTTVNDTLRYKPNQIQLAYDAGFSPGSKSDGLLFILPIRQSITRGFFRENDRLTVELFSLPKEAYYFIQQLLTESQNGGIFATPLSNIPSNIINLDSKSKKKALGVFFVSKVEKYSVLFEKNKSRKKK
jgi:hypothetical protein